MLRFEWNALRAGDAVIVHDLENSDMTLLSGTVMTVDTRAGRKLVNGVRIRVNGDDGVTRLLWPAYMAVHLEPLDPTEPCWRCEEMATRLEGAPEASRDEPTAELVGPPAPRQCGRCRGFFPGDATLPLGVETSWWACPPCYDLLVGPGAAAVPSRR
jgi:hypothetical protein